MGTTPKNPVVMSIGGLDPSAGAGVLADIKTISAFGCYGVAVATSLTLQNTIGVYGALHQQAAIVEQQMRPLLDDFEIAAIKTGMLPTRDCIERVAGSIRTSGVRWVVVDPIIRSTSGRDLMEDIPNGIDALVQRLFPLASLVTPNQFEAELIAGIHILDAWSLEQAARAILDKGPEAVLITGGAAEGNVSTDALLDSGGLLTLAGERVESKNTHGTGCAMASSIACLLARGFPLRESVRIAKRYVYEAIKRAPGLGRGYGPLNHFPPGFKEVTD
jgi:hydroxymethylpyrimidine kinase/phosphomethylpyrimidine kinase